MRTIAKRTGVWLLLALTASVALAAEPPKAEGDSSMTEPNYLNMPFKTITGHDTTLADFQGKVLLVVNVASECGYTPQYAGLERLYEQFKDSGLVVIGFPANNFGSQEPGTNEQILKFCQSKFNVTFPMMAKVSVKGKDKHPLFTYLTEQSSVKGEIKWNFSKFLLDREGTLVARFDSGVAPDAPELTSRIVSLF
jgi:glutathione peroxidase